MTILREFLIHSGLGPAELYRIIESAPARYKHYHIPKRRGGHRMIAQPSQELKLLQRYLVDRYFSKFRVHECAFAYRHKMNIRDNAEVHRGSRVILKLDFEQFFPSIKRADLRRYFLRRGLEYTDDVKVIERVVFWGKGTNNPLCLSIGAPSSPILSNILMFDVDCQLQDFAIESHANYTRYADDITVSADSYEQVLAFEEKAYALMRRTRSPNLKFNQSKRGLYARGQRRMVTGLILTPDAQISIGRGRKRIISALVHKYAIGALNIDDIAYLKGLLGFALGNEPQFVERLKVKYGAEVVLAVLGMHIPGKAEREEIAG